MWKRQTANNGVSKKYGSIADYLLFYTKGNRHTWNQQYGQRSESAQNEFRYEDDDGRVYRTHDLTAPGRNPNRMFEWQGTIPYRNWAYSRDDLDAMLASGKILLREDGTVSASRGQKIYLDEQRGAKLQSIWNDVAKVGTSKERTGYPTQKPLALLHRIIKASSNEGNVVFDPFCGCATACVAAEQLNRRWIGIDISPSAEDITKLRLQEIVDEGASLFNPFSDVSVRTEPPERIPDDATQIRLPKAHVHKHELYGVQEGKCNLCLEPFHFRNLTVDHIHPRSKGGTDRRDNLQLVCNFCNSKKGDRPQAVVIAELKAENIRRETPRKRRSNE